MDILAIDRSQGGAGMSAAELEQAVDRLLAALGKPRRVLVVPPDITRLHSRAGELCALIHRRWKDRIAAFLPATGTHAAMTASEIAEMFPGVPPALFVAHDYRKDGVELGRVAAARLRELSEGHLDFDYPVRLSRLLVEGGFDLVLSVGQVVPHEVVGMANHNKNILIGLGDKEGIDKSHFLGAVYGMERIMGRAGGPVRALLDAAEAIAAPRLPPVCYVLSVLDAGGMAGLFAGSGKGCFRAAAALSARLNIAPLPAPLARAVAWMPPRSYKSTWLACKAIYRTRMAMADGGRLLIIAPGLARFGEDAAVDALIARHGYRGRDGVLGRFARDPELAANMAVAAHLIHGSTEGRFTAAWACPPSFAPRLEAAGFPTLPLADALQRYAPEGRSTGFARDAEGEYLFIDNPGRGLWTAPRATPPGA